jgi:hypothetical protein
VDSLEEKLKKLLMAAMLFTATMFAQNNDIVLRGLSVYAGADETNPPIVGVGYGNLTIQYDILANEPPELKIRFWHCNRHWVVDNNLFVNDNNRNTSFYLNYETSPGAVKGYSYRYINSFPDGDAVRFEYSGNWIFRITDKREKTLFAEGRFFVVEYNDTVAVRGANAYLTANASPYNQVHKVIARFPMQEIESSRYTTADVYQNRRFSNAYRIDMWDRDPYTFVKGQGTGERIFSITNIMPGNEYRVFDFSDANRYPNNAPVKNVNGVDQQRLFWRTGLDRNGTSTTQQLSGVNSDYLDVMFRLDMTQTDYRSVTRGGKEVFLVGEFNFWNPKAEDKLLYDDNERAYVVNKFLRRGIYDYQYVTGNWDATNSQVVNQDWLAIEGNDWRTTNTYTVFIYYNDPRFGGFDRIVGYGVGRSSGSAYVGTN